MSGPREPPEPDPRPAAEGADGETQPEVAAFDDALEVEPEVLSGFFEPTPPPLEAASPELATHPEGGGASGAGGTSGAEGTSIEAPREPDPPLDPVPREPAWDDWVEDEGGSGFGGGDGPFPVSLEDEALGPRRDPGDEARWAMLREAAAGALHRSARSTVASAALQSEAGYGVGLEGGSPPRAEGPLGARNLAARRPVRRPVDEVRVERRRPKVSSPPAGSAPRPRKTRPAGPPRRYPKLRALLSNPELVPEGSAPMPEPRPPPVPGTFIPSPPPRPPPAEPTELDQMLALMADGLFIREGDSGATEIRVTLKDEFFSGTELRIALDEGGVAATLVPPSREIYWQLGGEAGQLRGRLEERGLRVARLEVVEPER